MWNDLLQRQIINLNKGLLGFLFLQYAAITFFLNMAIITVKSQHKAQLAFQ